MGRALTVLATCLVLGGLAYAQYPSRGRMSAPVTEAATVGDGGYVYSGVWAAGQTGAVRDCDGVGCGDAGFSLFGATSGFVSNAATGNNGFACVTAGCRFDLSTAGANDHFSSDGTTVTFAGPISSTAATFGTTQYGTMTAASSPTGKGIGCNSGGACGMFGNTAHTMYAIQDSAGTFVLSGGLTVATTTTSTGAFVAGSALNKGSKVLSGGTGTVTVTSGAKCVCTNETTALEVTCPVAATTLTITSGAGTDTVSYICL